MASNDIYKACARRVTEHHLACKSITDDIRAIREQVSGSSGPEKQNLEAMLEIRMQEKSDESRAGINAQIDLLNLVKDFDSTTVSGNILTELNRIFSGKGLDQLREQFEFDRDAAISGDGRLGRSNPNATLPTNAFPLPAQIPPPSNGPRRSPRVSAAPEGDYFNDLADTRDDTENSPEDVEPEDSSDDDLMSVNDIDEMFNDLEEADAEDNGPSTATAIPVGSDKYKHFTDENGRIRIGPQPMAPSVHVKWAPRREAIKQIMKSTHSNYLATDRKIRTSAPVDHDSELAAFQEKLIEALTEYGSDSNKLTGTCDYTGVDFSWGPGYDLHITPLKMAQNRNTPTHLALVAALIRLHVRARMLQNMKQCNKHAIKAGLAESLDPQILMNWMAHHFCKLIQRLKMERPTASREEILWNILDRWRFPIVPWARHALKASFCKLDHGPFDPLVHIDLEGCTVTIDTWVTNNTMRNYSTMDWDSIRKLISKVPLSHSYWDVDPTLGDEMWMGEWDRTIKPVAPPSPAFRMFLEPFRPLDLWHARLYGIQMPRLSRKL
ncbi:hypothetical protein ACHAPE_008495 [Trichoderma viride]